jgi:transposase
LKFANASKIKKLQHVLQEYSRVVNIFVDRFWDDCPNKMELLASRIAIDDSWLCANLRKTAAREAIDLITTVKKHPKQHKKPKHAGTSMRLSRDNAQFRLSDKTAAFDAWLHLCGIGQSTIIDLPIKLHKQWHKWNAVGRLLNSFVVSPDFVQFAFEIDVGPKLPPTSCIGLDTGINTLATLSTGEQLGTDLKDKINVVLRKKRGSKGYKRAVRTLRQRMDEVAKKATDGISLLVVENLSGIKTSRRLSRNTRRLVSNWQLGHWFQRLEKACQEKNVSFRTVPPYKTSQICQSCGHVDQRNRHNQKFLCRKCGFADNADINAAKNILQRHLTGPFGAGCKPKDGNGNQFANEELA